MAGRKKQPELTAEEKLQQALVPEAEQPYKVPDNWCWVHLLDTFVNYTDSKKKIKQKDYLNGGLFPIIDQGKSLIGGFTNNNELVFNDKLPIIIFGDHTRCIKYIDFSFVQGADGVKVLKPQSFYNEKLFYYALQNLNIEDLGYRRHFPTFYKYVMPIPPLAEQQRIVERIETLFAKLDEAKEKLQNTLDTFETRKATILHKAFTGELTANWRKQHGLTMDSWEEKTLQDVCSMKITDGTHKTPTYCDAEIGVPFLSAKDITSGKICWDNIKYITQELHEELYTRLQPQVDDILLAKNGTTGIAAIIDIEKIFDIYVTLAVLRPNQNIIYPRYLLNIVNSSVCKNQFDEHLTGIGVPNLHLRDIKQVTIPVPTLAEQTEIVRIIDNLLDKEQQAQQLAQNALSQIDLIKKSILARAFRGQLATNNHADEPAIELLKRVL